MEQRLERRVQEKNSGILRYPLPIPYGIAETVKGWLLWRRQQRRAQPAAAGQSA